VLSPQVVGDPARKNRWGQAEQEEEWCDGKGDGSLHWSKIPLGGPQGWALHYLGWQIPITQGSAIQEWSWSGQKMWLSNKGHQPPPGFYSTVSVN
jgi:hypothetical protein